MSKVLVTDASKREALAIIRSLGKKGIEVTAADSTCFNIGFLSRYCKHRVLYSPPEKSKTKFVRSMLELVKRKRFDLLIPVTDFTVMPVSEHKEDFEKYVRVATPKYETILKAFDKALTMQIATEHNIPHPKTFIIEDKKCIRKVAEEINYPAVIKPRMRVVWASDQAITLKVTHRNYAYDEFDLVAKYSEIATMLEKLGASSYLPMVQEYVAGEGYGVEVLMHNSEPRAMFMHRRIREYPISGGASTLRESITDEKLGNLGVKLLKAMRWNGVAMVEFKVDKLNCEPKLMEVNGRFWGSLALAIAAGVDFPYLLYQIAVKGEQVKLPSYRDKVKQRWLIPGDILWLVSSILSAKDKFGSIENFIKTFTIPDDIIALNDPAPTFGAIVGMLRDCVDVIAGRRTMEGEIVPAKSSLQT
ncbi:MAG: ATP-grasp domain-containing protein [Candidatus Bathyarchaeota archaeon]|nr:ATP-grasp domain-containing protein [Candidatus Bathyarchaeota archaeon]